MLTEVSHSAGGLGKVDRITEKGLYVSFAGPDHGSNFFPNNQVCTNCKIVFPSEAIAALHVAHGHRRAYPYCVGQ